MLFGRCGLPLGTEGFYILKHFSYLDLKKTQQMSSSLEILGEIEII